MARVTLEIGDLTTVEVDAIVNAAKPSLTGGGGVDGAIHRAAGPQLLQACLDHPVSPPEVRCPIGEARATRASGALRCRYVIHAVGPRYHHDPNPAALLTSAHQHALRVAAELDCHSVAFPAISCGVYGYPVDEAAPIAISAALAAQGVDEVRFVLFDQRVFDAFQRALRGAESS